MRERLRAGRTRSATGRWFVVGLTGGAAVALAVGLAVERDATADDGDPVVARFVDETAAAGLEHVYDGGFTYFVGGGVAVLDCDDDGLPDLYLAGGANPAALYHNRSAVGGPLRFEAVRDPATDLSAVLGAYPLDVDSDGHPDLAVLRDGENVLLRGRGDCRFERANEVWSVDGGDDWTVAFSATWERGEELPTFVFGNYLDLSEGRDRARCADHALVRPDGSRAFAPAVAFGPGYCTLSSLFTDWGRTGHRDLRMTNDRHYHRDGEDQLWRVEPGRPPAPYTSEDGWEHLRIWGMGIASQDLTGDGRPEVFLTSQGDNKLQTLVDASGRPTYEDIAIERGVTAHRPHTGGDVRPSTAWHGEFDDVNNDGLVDLFVSKGNVEAQEGFALRDPDDLLLGRADGTFVEAAADAGIVRFTSNRGAALTDLNLDGLLDLVEVRRRENVGLWRNVGEGDADRPSVPGHWIALRLEQDGPNRDAVGAWIEIRADDRTLTREVTVGGGHASGQHGWIHVGLGDAGSADVRVVWPDGDVGPWQPIAADAFVTIVRRADPRVWTPDPTGAAGPQDNPYEEGGSP